MITVDSTVLVDVFRGRSSPAAVRFARLEADGEPFSIPAICVQEVLQGARDEAEWKRLAEALFSQALLLPLDSIAVHREAAGIFFDGRRRGLTIRSTVDCLIAAIVLEAGAILLHGDEDFDRIAKIRPLRTIRE